MSRFKSKTTSGSSFEIQAKAPVDSRTLVESIDELYNPDNWEYIYKGLVVMVLNDADGQPLNALYSLIDISDVTKESSWKRLDSGNSSSSSDDWEEID